MCRIYTATDPELYQCVTRSVRLQGCVTSVRLEREFWLILEEIAARQQLSAGQFISQLYAEVIEEKGEVGNLASLLRVACAIYLKEAPMTADARIPNRSLPAALGAATP